MTLTVLLTRHPSRNLAAHVVQQDAERVRKRCNLLAGRKIRKIETARLRVYVELKKLDPECTIRFDEQAAADTPTPYKSARRRELAEVLSS